MYLLFLSPKEMRFDYASSLQGLFLSQSIFEILKYQDPSNDEIYFEQSIPYNKRGNYEMGFKLLDEAVRLKPIKHLGYRGYMKLRFLRDFKGALNDFNRLDSLTPNFQDTSWGEDLDFLRGEAYFGLNNFEKSIFYFDRNVKNQGEDWVDIQTFIYIGLSEYELRNLERAKEQFEKALYQSQYTVEAHLGLAKIYFENGDVANMAIHLEKADEYLNYKRDDPYNEFLNEIYKEDIENLKLLIEFQ